jgi:hypothetical protein
MCVMLFMLKDPEQPRHLSTSCTLTTRVILGVVAMSTVLPSGMQLEKKLAVCSFFSLLRISGYTKSCLVDGSNIPLSKRSLDALSCQGVFFEHYL